jgi:hypothetical protein
MIAAGLSCLTGTVVGFIVDWRWPPLGHLPWILGRWLFHWGVMASTLWGSAQLLIEAWGLQGLFRSNVEIAGPLLILTLNQAFVSVTAEIELTWEQATQNRALAVGAGLALITLLAFRMRSSARAFTS